MFKKIVLVSIALALMTPVFVSAQGLKDAGKILNKVADPSKTGLSSDLGSAIATVIKTILALVGTIFLVLTIYAGVMWMTAQGAEEPVEKAKEIIKASIIGLVIIMSAYAITYFVTTKLGAVAGTNQQSNNVPPVNTANLGCCHNASSGQNIPSVQSDCTGFQEVWTLTSC
ncbi:MAG TPA: pilin [Candidatus Udaeobacter sp.]|nr:pilin [Candidatus Udaeobacter sp.]